MRRARRSGSRRGIAVATGLAILASALIMAAPSWSATGTWERAWGKDVIQTGGSGDTGTGFEICTLAAACQQGIGSVLGGELNLPHGIATDGGGNVYVANLGNARVDKFDAAGNWKLAWGTDVIQSGAAGDTGTGFEICTVAAACKTGGNDGRGGAFLAPFGIAVDPAGDVFVSDPQSNRIQKFDSSGHFEAAWGKNVIKSGGAGDTGAGFEICTVAADCQTGSSGTLGGEFSTGPADLATDSAGNVYASDVNNDRIQKFDSSGNFQRAWGKDVIQSGGTGDTGTGFEVCTVPADCKAGTFGGLGGELANPVGIAVSGSQVYVGETGDARVQKFDTSGTWDRAWGYDVVQGGGTGFEICTVASSCKIGAPGAAGGQSNGTYGIAVDGLGEVYTSELNNYRIEVFDSSGNFSRAWGRDVIKTGAAGDTGTGFEICNVASDCQSGASGGLGGELNQPFGLAVGVDDSLYVADRNNDRIQRFASAPPPTDTGPPPGGGGGVTPASGPTGQQAAALKKCKKRFRGKAKAPKRKKCIKAARKLPV